MKGLIFLYFAKKNSIPEIPIPAVFLPLSLESGSGPHGGRVTMYNFPMRFFAVLCCAILCSAVQRACFT